MFQDQADKDVEDVEGCVQGFLIVMSGLLC